jgi:hypothetical protein
MNAKSISAVSAVIRAVSRGPVDRRRPEFNAANEASARARPRRLSVDDLDGELDARVLREIISNESAS